MVCGAWPGGELTAWQSVGTGEQSRAGSPGEHYHLLQDNATYVVGASWYSLGISSTSGYLKYPVKPRELEAGADVGVTRHRVHSPNVGESGTGGGGE